MRNDKMDDFAIDLDKVLDDFEISEGSSQNPLPSAPSKPSQLSFDDLDLSEANFAPAVTKDPTPEPTFLAEPEGPVALQNGATNGDAAQRDGAMHNSLDRPELLHNMDIENAFCSEQTSSALPSLSSHSQPDVVPVNLTPVLDVREASCHCEQLPQLPELQLRDFLQGKHGPHVHAGGDNAREEAAVGDEEHSLLNHREADTNHSYSILDDAMPSLSSQEPSLPPPAVPVFVEPRETPVVAEPNAVLLVAEPHEAPVVAEPHEAPVVAEPHEAPVVAEPHEAPVVAEPHEAPVVSEPHEAPLVAVPHETPVVAEPHETPVVAEPRETPVVAEPHETPVVAEPHETPVVAEPHETSVVAEPHETSVVAEPHEISVVAESHETSVVAEPLATPVATHQCAIDSFENQLIQATVNKEVNSKPARESESLVSAEESAHNVPCENGQPSEEDVEEALRALELCVNELPAPGAIDAVAIANELSTELSPDVSTPVLPTPDRRSSGGSIERFLNPSILSPSITTPMEDTGMSMVPGFTPDLDSMAEVKEEEEEEATPTPSCVRPKDPPAAEEGAACAGKRKRPNSLLGLSTPDLSAMSVTTEESMNPHDEINRQIAQQCNEEKQSVVGEAVTNVSNSTRQIQPPNTLVGLSIPMHDNTVLPASATQRRPNSLNLSVNSVADLDPKPLTHDVSELATAENASVASSESSVGAHGHPATAEELSHLVAEAALPSDSPPPPMSANINIPITHLGRFAPIWLPDAEAPNCMQCETRFTFTKRRHHCRACGKVFCSTCCNLKSRLGHLNGKEARVCSRCYQDLVRAQVFERMHAESANGETSQPQVSPNPNNPSEYCSTIPPMQQVQANAPPPTVMVPSTVGVLRKQGSIKRNEPKQVMFSDGIRPGGDLTELDGSSDVPTRLPSQRTGRKVKVVERSSEENTAMKTRTVKSPEATRHTCLIPETGLPPVILQTGVKGDYSIEENPDSEKIMAQIESTEDVTPVVFAINKNLFVIVKIVSLECCVNRVCWNFTTKGMCTVNQAEIMFVLECLPQEKTIPRDIFTHLNSVYEDASRGNPVSNLSHVIFTRPFLDSRDHGGVLYMQPTFQCQQKLILPSPPYLYGILLQKWETPWAKVFPLRLMLRLGAEFRYYPCPLISVRFRKPVYGEIGHTIMNLLADFRNYQYMLPTIKGVTVHMEDKWTYVNFPRNRYDQVMKVVNSSNDHVMALGANFSSEADSHLICYQNDEGTYQTQAINIQNKPRQVTGASFVVFNGALKTSAGMRAKSSIVEDGVMVQVTAESLAAMKDAMKEMHDYTIPCGSFDLPQPDEHVKVQWVDDDKRVNIGVVSPIDGTSMEGIQSIHIHHATDYAGEKRAIRWTECFFMKNEDQSNPRFEPVDQSRLAETLAQACCIALTKHLDPLKEAGLAKIALRATIDAEQVGYEVGSNGQRLPDFCMNDLDNELIAVIHNAASHTQDAPVLLELVFHIVE